MSDTIDISSLILNNKINIEDPFFSKVKEHNVDENGIVSNSLCRRMADPICQKCFKDYKEKYPEIPFEIKCNGIYQDEDFIETYEILNEGIKEDNKEHTSLEEVRQILDVEYWARKNCVSKDEFGDISAFEPRHYQSDILKCTAEKKVDRLGRGLGKTITGVVEELHWLNTNKNKFDLIIGPSKNITGDWYRQFLFQIENSPTLKNFKKKEKQTPFFQIFFNNNSRLGIFTTGASSGRGAENLRGQDPDRVRIDEQDYLNPEDYDPIFPLLNRHTWNTFHGSSTPSGNKSDYYRMCKELPMYKEFYYPIYVKPGYNEEMELNLKKECKTEERWKHEYLAEFSDPKAGVFKQYFVQQSIEQYLYKDCIYDSSKTYHLGTDWNGEGTGTRITVVEYNPITGKRKKVEGSVIDNSESTFEMSIQEIIRLNKKWHCSDVFIDKGYGAFQDERIKMIGFKSSDPDTQKLKFIKAIDFGANLTFNNLVSNRSNPNIKSEEELETRTKPFMVEGVVMAFESGLITLAYEDELLLDQIRGYRVKNWSKGGQANTYTTDSEYGDHDLDSFMLALLSIEMRHGLWKSNDNIVSNIATISFLESSDAFPNKLKTKSDISRSLDSKELDIHISTIPGAFSSSQGAIITPARRSNFTSTSRTDFFRRNNGDWKY